MWYIRLHKKSCYKKNDINDLGISCEKGEK